MMQHGVSPAELETPYGQVALAFSVALLNRQYQKAYALLGSEVCQSWPPALLQQSYEEMVDYFDYPANEVSIESVETDLPDPDSDSAMVYVSVMGKGNVEAVVMIVANEAGQYRIQDLEMGRP